MSEQKFVIDFHPNPLQRSFIESRADADLFSSRMGEGKSAAIAWTSMYHTRHNPGAKWLIVRDTMENLRSTTMQEFFKWFPPGIMGTYHQTHKLFTWAPGVAIGSVEFVGLDDPNDAGKLQSREIAGFAIDEAAPSAASGGVSEAIFDVALSRLRQSGMNWYAAKLAENNPEETHWTYRRFVDPGTRGFKVWQPSEPENMKNLPPNYYAKLREQWAHRPDFVARFLDGKFGFQQQGKAVTPEWNPDQHLALGLYPNKALPLTILWDFGLNPTAILTQVTPMGHWNILDAFVGDGIGVEELCDSTLIPVLRQRYPRFELYHIGDPAGITREASSSKNSAVNMIRRKLGGKWTSGPVRWEQRVDPLRAVLRKSVGKTGLVQVDRQRAAAVWHALRGGWHYHVARTGLISAEAVKDIHSHPGDAMGYGAAVLFPLISRTERKSGGKGPAPMSAWSSHSDDAAGPLGFERPRAKVPPEARLIGKP